MTTNASIDLTMYRRRRPGFSGPMDPEARRLVTAAHSTVALDMELTERMTKIKTWHARRVGRSEPAGAAS
jgi:hypothetical protein